MLSDFLFLVAKSGFRLGESNAGQFIVSIFKIWYNLEQGFKATVSPISSFSGAQYIKLKV